MFGTTFGTAPTSRCAQPPRTAALTATRRGACDSPHSQQVAPTRQRRAGAARAPALPWPAPARSPAAAGAAGSRSRTPPPAGDTRPVSGSSALSNAGTVQGGLHRPDALAGRGDGGGGAGYCLPSCFCPLKQQNLFVLSQNIVLK